MQISVVIIAKNESENLRRSLPRLNWCKDIVVVDDYSSDGTADIAKEFGARVFQRKFDGFGNQKRFGVEQAQFDWILNIDADELLSDELITELNTLSLSDNISAYMIPVRHVFMGRIFTRGKESYYLHMRLFDRRKANFDTAAVHEKVISTGQSSALKHVILHYSYRDLSHYFTKFNKYTDAGAGKLFKEGRKRNLLMCFAGFPVYFFKHYFLYLNILNGSPGLVWSYLSAWYHTVKYLKLYELNKNR